MNKTRIEIRIVEGKDSTPLEVLKIATLVNALKAVENVNVIVRIRPGSCSTIGSTILAELRTL